MVNMLVTTVLGKSSYGLKIEVLGLLSVLDCELESIKYLIDSKSLPRFRSIFDRPN